MQSEKYSRAFDVIGNIAIIKFPKATKDKEKKKRAENLLKKHKNIKTIVEKIDRVKGRLRKFATKHIAGEKTKEVLYKENNCLFKFNIDKTYFSPRLSSERKEIAQKIKKSDKVLVMFAGVAPYSIVIAKNTKPKKVVSVEINREASRYAKMNVSLNKLKDKVEIVQGDVKRIIPNFVKKKLFFEVIVMPRPQLKETFLQQSFAVSKKGTRIFYYDFGKHNEKKDIINKIKKEAKKAKKKIKILRTKHAGEIAPYKFRWRIDFKVLN